MVWETFKLKWLKPLRVFKDFGGLRSDFPLLRDVTIFRRWVRLI